MHKHLVFLSSAILVAACSQEPAPFDVYGTRYYGKNIQTTLRKNDYAGNNQGASPFANDYNSRIDAENSSHVLSRPLTDARGNSNPANSAYGNKNGEIYSHQLADSSGNNHRLLDAVPIDSDQQVVRLNNSNGARMSPIHAGGSLGNNIAPRDNDSYREPQQHAEETVPTVERKPGFINPPEANVERKAANNLSKIKPVAKPKYQEEAEDVAAAPVKAEPVQHEKAKIAAKIQKVETASGDIDKNTPKMANQQEVQDKKQTDDGAQNADSEDTKVPPVKLVETKPTDERTAVDEEASPTSTTEVSTAKDNMAAKAGGKGGQFIKPVDGVVISEFGNDKNGTFNDGINIQAPEGTPVKAALGGTVVYSGNQLQGYGNMIIIRHSNGYLSAYSHLKELELKKGESIGQGGIVGHVGKTGNVDTPQLHFGIRKGREPVDPKNYL